MLSEVAAEVAAVVLDELDTPTPAMIDAGSRVLTEMSRHGMERSDKRLPATETEIITAMWRAMLRASRQ